MWINREKEETLISFFFKLFKNKIVGLATSAENVHCNENESYNIHCIFSILITIEIIVDCITILFE